MDLKLILTWFFSADFGPICFKGESTFNPCPIRVKIVFTADSTQFFNFPLTPNGKTQRGFRAESAPIIDMSNSTLCALIRRFSIEDADFDAKLDAETASNSASKTVVWTYPNRRLRLSSCPSVRYRQYTQLLLDSFQERCCLQSCRPLRYTCPLGHPLPADLWCMGVISARQQLQFP